MLIDKVKKFIDEHRLFEKGEKVLVAVSGGIDSVVLLDLLVNLSPSYDFKLHVIHLDHGIRGLDSYEDALFVEKLALKYGLNFTIGRSDARLGRKGETLEESARKVRYSFFKRCLETVGANKIALAHNADDQVETVLMRIIRGTGPLGLCGMRPKTSFYVRPLLKVWRSEIEAYSSEKGLDYRTDITNYDPYYFRNRIRYLLLPILESYNPSIKEGLLRLSELMWMERDFVDSFIEAEFERSLLLQKEGEICFNSGALRANRFLFSEIIRRAIESLVGDFYGFSKEDIDSVWDKGKGVFNLPRQVVVKDDGEKICVFLRRQGEFLKREEWLFELNVPGVTKVPRGIIKAEYVSCFRKSTSEFEAFLDVDKLKFPLFVRNRKGGDRIQPLGMKGRKKLKKLFAEASIPIEERDEIPIVVDRDGDIVWVGGVKIAEKVKVDENSKRILHLVYLRGDSD
ncbi:MAG: tRNA lysidine(34) synthetase TilS [Synergistetes bacterium]|nr:tRNA lysidine(34) synthetase TilS [Synergistota bacterium]MCX8128050.1 tRNA lysidine(34) synthetase TilS [Synergistota bacterium]MDW8193088.1 tRNA lysidine(34) synthetase TilS [Synergistota bacterium]